MDDEAQRPLWEDLPKPEVPHSAVAKSAQLVEGLIKEFRPTHIVSLVSGGRDSAASDRLSRELQVPVDFRMHGRTGTGIPETTQHVIDYYGSSGPDLAIADAGTKYESYVMRKGFFGVGREAHNFSYRLLKQDPFNATLSRLIRKGRRGFRVMLLTGARREESANRKINLPVAKLKKGNLWVNPCHDWTAAERDQFNDALGVTINPVARELCRSGECMCGTFQDKRDRAEASVLYPHWGTWLDGLEEAARKKHGFGWGEPFPTPRDPNQSDLFEDFQPLCAGCKGSVGA